MEQLEGFATWYFRRSPKMGSALALARMQERALWACTSFFTPWSRWVADKLEMSGIPPERIRVIPPGVDLSIWQPRPEFRSNDTERVQLLFVGGDFFRKGGDILLDVFRAQFAESCELSIVTHEPIEAGPGVNVFRAEPNSDLLRRLYATSDLFVLPTQAECFGIAAIEALSSGLPVVMGNRGAAAEIVKGDTGWLIEPNHDELAAAIRSAVQGRQRLREMGERARIDAEQRFDGMQNDMRVLETVLEVCGRGS
jgi:glycosyltransferase involved in cell wall biosynthesis